ncbi:hypothetical protein HF521_018205 [Silurus meridionalis]|uniref:Ig-like domain-containing protein n=1 Tax=Silurus meridionalis TaxID=175797 RepID=A0A8T0BN43_SILME|nr:hypothetical protein HF521_018205 [Silurus meridionalis]
MEKTAGGFTLTIQHVIKKHGGLYYCEKCTVENITLSSGMFLTVTGDDEDVSVSVLQNGELDSVPAGASVTLQCSVLSESRAAELQVLWFRAAPSQSHPQLIYTHHNSSLQCESESSTHTCVYNLSKNIFSLNDTGTYYCAVVLCGKIIFGNGTRVQLEKVLQLVRPRHDSEVENTPSLGNNAGDMNYAAVNFSKTNSKRETRKRDQPAKCIYSSVSYAS